MSAALQLDLFAAPAARPTLGLVAGGPVSPRVRFFLGAHRPHWLEGSTVPLFVSHNTMRTRQSFPRATCPWALDSGAFTEISQHGHHRTSARDYAQRVELYQREIGRLEFASIQDWMCEAPILKRTGLSVAKHQALTIDNYIALRSAAPSVPWLPVVQGWAMGDHRRHVEMYARRGIDLRTFDRVGVGSICRRQATTHAGFILMDMAFEGIRVHAFGLKTKGLEGLNLDRIASADSMAWSFAARAEHARKLGQYKWLGREHELPRTGEQNSLAYAERWYQDLIVPRLQATEAAC